MKFRDSSTALLTSVLAFGVLACASGSGSEPPDQVSPVLPAEIRETSTGFSIRLAPEQLMVETEIRAGVDRAWLVVPRVYAALGIGGEVLDSRALVYGARRFTKSRVGRTPVSDYVRCAFLGAGPSAAGGYRTQLSIVTRIEGSSSEWTTVSSQISGTATAVEGTSTDAVRCVSNGNLERLIAQMVADTAGAEDR